jgi:cobalamin biosynthesis protein CobT
MMMQYRHWRNSIQRLVTTHASDATQLLTFVQDVTDKFDVITFHNIFESTTCEDLYENLSGTLERCNLSLIMLSFITVTTDGSPNLTGRNIDALKRLQGRMNVKSPDKEILPFSIYYSDELP